MGDFGFQKTITFRGIGIDMRIPISRSESIDIDEQIAKDGGIKNLNILWEYRKRQAPDSPGERDIFEPRGR